MVIMTRSCLLPSFHRLESSSVCDNHVCSCNVYSFVHFDCSYSFLVLFNNKINIIYLLCNSTPLSHAFVTALSSLTEGRIVRIHFTQYYIITIIIITTFSTNYYYYYYYYCTTTSLLLQYYSHDCQC